MFRSCFSAFIFLASLLPLKGQTVVTQPQKPRRGDTLEVVFYPGATVDAPSAPFFLFYLYGEEGQSESMLLQPEKQKQHYRARFKIKEELSSLELHIINREERIVDSTFRFIIYNPNGQPARNSLARYALAYMDEARDSLLKRELALYPDNYPAWQMYWANQKRLKVFEEFSLRDSVSAFYKALQIAAPQADAGLVYLLAHIYLILGNRDKYLFYLDKLTREYPASPITKKYLSVFKVMELYRQKQLMPRTKRGESPGLTFKGIYKRWQKCILKDYPEYPSAMKIAGEYINKPDVPEKDLLRVFKEQIQRDPDNPKPYFFMAKLYYERFKDRPAAERYLRQARQKYNSAVKPRYFSPYFPRVQKEFEQDLDLYEKYLWKKKRKTSLRKWGRQPLM